MAIWWCCDTKIVLHTYSQRYQQRSTEYSYTPCFSDGTEAFIELTMNWNYFTFETWKAELQMKCLTENPYCKSQNKIRRQLAIQNVGVLKSLCSQQELHTNHQIKAKLLKIIPQNLLYWDSCTRLIFVLILMVFDSKLLPIIVLSRLDKGRLKHFYRA